MSATPLTDASEIETLFDRVLNGMRMDAPPGAVPALYRLREIAMRAGHAGINQCDGCRRGLPLRGNGIHYEDKPFSEAMPVMACEKDKYK